MRNGFIYNQNLCVNCRACIAACILENKWTIHARSIITYNSDISSAVPVINLSLACNHCEVPVCLESCPTSSYSRDISSGAIIIDDSKCIGCKYCIWNCPFEAPQFDRERRVIGKCHLCYASLDSGLLPACVNGCPTGALRFGNTDDNNFEYAPVWFPGAELNPAIKFSDQVNNTPLKIIPDEVCNEQNILNNEMPKGVESEWSLVFFSYLTAVSVSILTSSLLTGGFPDKVLFLILTILPGIISLLHLGRSARAWRAVSNVKSSPLSREILLYAIYSLISCISVLYELPGFLLASSVTGLFLLIAIDSVYYYSRKSASTYLNPGQTFLTALLMTSFLSGNKLPFIFVAAIKLVLSVYGFLKNNKDNRLVILRFLRITFLFIAGASLLSGISYPENPVIALFFTGELVDRILYYIEFEPYIFSRFIKKHIASVTNEKERD